MTNPGAVTVAYVHNGRSVTYSWHLSLTKLLMWDSHHHKRVVRGGFATIKAATDGVTGARNTAIRDFLAGSDAEWLWWVDTDMGFAPDTVDQLVQAADPVERPVVGGLTFAQQESGSDGMGGYRPAVWPVLLDWSDTPGDTGFLPRLDYPVNTLTRCAGTGSACILIHRTVFERLAKDKPEGWFGWYSRLPSPKGNGDDLSEDLSFCLRLRQAGIPVHVHTGVRTTHMKPVWLNEEGYLAGRSMVKPTTQQPREWRLWLTGDAPYMSTAAFHANRERAAHLEQAAHRPRLLAAAAAVNDLAQQLDNPTVSDLGCGDGGLLSLLECEAWGYDFQPSNAQGWVERGVKAELLDAFGNDRDLVRFGDITVLTEVLEHVADPRGVLRWVKSRYVVASSPRNETGEKHAPEHAWAWNEAGFAKLFTDTGWSILRHEPIGGTQLIVAERQ